MISGIESLRGKVEIREQVNGAYLSTFSTGGVVDYLVLPSNSEQMQLVIAELRDNYIMLGKGSNTLISDYGVRVPIISTEKMDNISIDGNYLYCEAGASMSSAYNLALLNKLSGIERLSGIPCSIGGACYMNAGAFGMEFLDIVNKIELIEAGDKKNYSASELDYTYRNSGFYNKNVAICKVVLELTFSDRSSIIKLQRECLEKRKKAQPVGKSLGSVFKAAGGIPAWRYIDPLDIAGTQIGGAYLSDKHCNFILNAGSATSSDYIALARLVQERVYDSYGVLLQAEYDYIGDNNADIRRLSYAYNT